MDSGLMGLLGLARKAGKTQLGEEAAVAATLEHRVRLILLASDTAENTRQRVARAAEAGNAKVVVLCERKAQLGDAVGLSGCGVVALSDVGFAAAVAKKLAQEDPTQYGQLAQELAHRADKTVRRRREKMARQKAASRSKPWAAPPEGKK